MAARAIRIAVAALAVGLPTVAAPAAAGADSSGGPAPATPAVAPAPGVQLLAQTPWIEGHGTFGLRLGVDVPDPATDTVRVLVFPRLVTRTDFQAAATGKVNSYAIYSAAPTVATLPTDPAGGVDVSIPVDSTAPARSPVPAFQTTVQGGVYPVQVSVADQSGHAIGNPFTTFMVYAQGAQDTTGYPPLSVAVVVPFRSPAVIGPAGRLGGPPVAEADRLQRLARVLAVDSSVPASVLASPITVASLQAGAAAGSAPDRDTLAQLAATPQGGLVQVLPSTYSDVSPGDLAAAGLTGEADRQIEAGQSTLASAFGVAPAPDTWVTDGPVDDATVSTLLSHHVSRLIVPDSDLSPVASVTTFGYPTTLSFGTATPTVMAADPGIAADFTRAEPPVLAANQLLAELAMIQTETPGYSRAVVAMPPPGWTVSPTFVSTLLTGLAGDPLLRAVTASDLFRGVRTADVTRTLAHPSAAGSSPAGQALARASDEITSARAAVSALAALLPGPSTQVTDLRSRLLAAESSTLSSARRDGILRAIVAESGKVTGMVSLPAPTSMTLTSTKGQLPITVLTGAGLKPRLELHLVSQRLIFHSFDTPEGPCTAATTTKLICTLVLTARNTTLKVPVETRSSGVFQLDVYLYPPGAAAGAWLAHDTDTVRSTAVSSVGIIVGVVAVLSLLVWWVRDLRHGRRPRKLAPPPGDDPDAVATLGEDLDGFFSSPPPEWPHGGDPPGHMSPLPGDRGPRHPSG